MSKRLKQVSLFFDAAHSMSSEVIDFHIWFSPDFSDAVAAGCPLSPNFNIISSAILSHSPCGQFLY